MAGGKREWQPARSAAQGTKDIQPASQKLVRMAAELQRPVGQFKFDERVTGAGATEVRPAAKQVRETKFASRAKTQPGVTTRLQ